MTKGWERKSLGDVLTLEYGKPLPKELRDEDGKYPAYGANGIKCRTNEYYWDKPTIIVGRKGSAGEVNLTDEKFWPLDVTYFVDFDEKQYDLTFLYHCLVSLDLPKLAKGVKPGVNRNDVYSIEFAFPPYPEQKRIVAILDEAFAGIAQAITNDEKNLANTRELFESYLNDVFIRKGKRWMETTIGDIADVKGGKRVPKGYKLQVEPTSHPYISVTNFNDDGGVDVGGVRFVSNDVYNKISRYIITPKDLYISIAGTIGKTGVIPEELDGANLTENACRLVFSEGINNRFIYFFTRTPLFADQAVHNTRIAAQPKLALSRLKTIKLSIPPVEEQKRIVIHANTLLEQTKNLESIYQQKLTALAELKQSILQKAFVGELTAEPAKRKALA